jgi:thioesterase domain-containing protein
VVRRRPLSWRLGYAVRRRDEAWSLIYDSASDAGVLELRKGDRRLPALVTFHGGLGTPAGALLPSYLRAEVTVVALQAPELRDPTVPSPGSAAGRARAYCAAAADHLGPGSRGVALLGHSHGAYVAFLAAPALEAVHFFCLGLHMVDPEALSPQTHGWTPLQRRGQVYDMLFEHVAPSDYLAAVSRGDLATEAALEAEVRAAFPDRCDEYARLASFAELSRAETAAFHEKPPPAAFAGPAVVFVADRGPDFFAFLKYPSFAHEDGVYGWSRLLRQIRGPIRLACGHLDPLLREATLRLIAESLTGPGAEQ